MNYSHHRKAQAEREALKAKQSELKELSGSVRHQAEKQIIEDAGKEVESEEVSEETEVESSPEQAQVPARRGRKPRA